MSLRAYEHGENELGARAVCVGRLAEMQRAHLRAAPGVVNSGQYRAAAAAWGATVRGTYGTAEAGTRSPYVPYAGPWGQAALRVRYVPNAGGWDA